MSRKLGEVKPCNHCDLPIMWLRTERSPNAHLWVRGKAGAR